MTELFPFSYITRLGAWLINVVTVAGDFFLFFATGVGTLVRHPPRIGHVMHQMVRIGLESVVIATLTAFFVGMVMVLNTGYQLGLFGLKSWSGGITAIALAREMVPVFTAVVVGARVAASIAAEVGTMKVTEQIDAIEINGVNPISLLVAPRVIAALFTLPLLTVYSLALGLLGSVLVGQFALQIPMRQFWESSLTWLKLGDVYMGLAKTFVFALIIVFAGCHQGFRARGGAAGVGRATTNAVVASLIAILISNYIMSTWILILVQAL